MKKNFLVLLMLCTFQSFSQNKIDIESTRLEKLCRKNSRTPDSLFFYGQKLLSFGKKHEHLKASIEGYFALGLASSLHGKEDIAITYLDSAIVYKDKAIHSHFSEMMRIMRNKAIIYSRKSEFEKAEKVYNQIINECKAQHKMADAAYNYNGLGIISKEQGNYNKALSYYKKAMNIWDSIGRDSPKTTLFLNIGIVQTEQGNYLQGKLSYKQGLEIAEKNKNERDIYKFYNNLSIVHRDIKEYDSAYYYLRKVIPYFKNKNIPYQEYLGYMNIGNTLFQERKLDSAYWYLQKSLRGLKPTQQVKSIGQNYRLISYVLFHKNKYKDAKVYLDSSHAINNEHNLQNNLARDYNLYARIYEKLDDFKNANHYYKLEKKINDSIYSATTAKDYNELLVTQNVKQHKSKIQQLSKVNTFYKSNLFIVSILGIGLGFFSFIVYKNYKTGKNEIKKLQEELDVFKESHKSEEVTTNFIHLKSKAIINTNEILFIKSDGHYIEIFIETKNKPEIERSTLTEFLNSLPENDFIRIHKSYVVNIHKIKIINSTQIMLINGEWIKLSRTYKQQLKDILNKE